MSPLRSRSAILAIVFLCAAPAHALRVVNYNLTNYPGSTSAARNPRFQTILGPVGADVIVCQEMISQAGVDQFRDNVLNVLEPGQWAAAPFTNGNDSDNALFYKTAKCTLLASWSFYPNPANLLRLVNVYVLRPVNYTSSTANLRIYSQHLKASTGFEEQRRLEAVGIRDSMNAIPPGGHAILMGDFNIYDGSEPAFQVFIASTADNDGRIYDPQNAPYDWDNNPAAAIYNTQCPCLNNCPVGYGFAGGGMDSRFDMLLPTYPMNNGQGLDFVPGSYKPIGQDGLHYNTDLNVAPVIPEGQTYANALVGASDHLPVRLDVQVPAKISVVASLAFGTVITGASAAQTLAVSNPAAVPGDELDYSFTPDAGFGAPGGTFFANAGAAANMHSITMSTATPGVKSGQLHIATDDPDNLTKNVGLSGTVLAHAVASLESLTTVTAADVDFGDQEPGMFANRTVRVHNRGWTSLQARLNVTSAAITGGGGRFTLVGGSTPVLVSGVATPFTVHFDDSGATPDSVYNATLTFGSADEPLPGATAQPNLVVTLRAQVVPTDVAGGIPGTTRLFAPFPNPLQGPATVRFDLAQPADVQLDVFDVAGRRVVRIAGGAYPAGRHRLAWAPRRASGEPLAAGVYFVRLARAGAATQTVRVTLVR